METLVQPCEGRSRVRRSVDQEGAVHGSPGLARAWLTSLLFVFLASAIAGAILDSQTVDEGVHLATGHAHWRTGRVRLSPEHPPLARLWESAPLLLAGARFPSDHPSWRDGDVWEFSRQFVDHNEMSAGTILLLGRLPVIVLTLLLAIVFYRTSRARFGVWPSLVAVTFLVSDPTIRAHGRLATTDLPVSLLFFVTTGALASYVTRPSRRTFAVLALSFGAAQLTKFSALLLWPAVILAFAVAARRHHRDPRRSSLGAPLAWNSLGALAATTALLIWLVHGFEITRPIEHDGVARLLTKASSSEGQSPGLVSMGQRLARDLARLPIPAFTYLAGIGDIVLHDTYGQKSYLAGVSHAVSSSWAYFPTALAVKSPPVVLLLLVTALCWWTAEQVASRRRITQPPERTIPGIPREAEGAGGLAALGADRPLLHPGHGSRVSAPATARISSSSVTGLPRSWDVPRRHEKTRTRNEPGSPPTRSDAHQRNPGLDGDAGYVWILVPAVFFLAALTSRINLGIRHLLPVLPFLYLGVAWLAARPFFRRLPILLVVCLAAHLPSSIATFPDELAYFSEAVGGSEEGSRYLLDSNLDWGQGFGALRDWLDREQPERLYGIFFTTIDLAAHGIVFHRLPSSEEVARDGPPDGVVAISASVLFDPTASAACGWLRRFPPKAVLRRSIYLYDFSTRGGASSLSPPERTRSPLARRPIVCLGGRSKGLDGRVGPCRPTSKGRLEDVRRVAPGASA